jgi:hypothetical protein
MAASREIWHFTHAMPRLHLCTHESMLIGGRRVKPGRTFEVANYRQAMRLLADGSAVLLDLSQPYRLVAGADPITLRGQVVEPDTDFWVPDFRTVVRLMSEGVAGSPDETIDVVLLTPMRIRGESLPIGHWAELENLRATRLVREGKAWPYLGRSAGWYYDLSPMTRELRPLGQMVLGHLESFPQIALGLEAMQNLEKGKFTFPMPDKLRVSAARDGSWWTLGRSIPARWRASQTLEGIAWLPFGFSPGKEHEHRRTNEIRQIENGSLADSEGMARTA